MAYKIYMPDGTSNDIVLGFDNIQDYLSADYLKIYPFMGAAIGRYSNRIKNASFKIDDKEFAVSKNWDADQLRQVFVNVIANAVDASQENAAVRIATERLSLDGHDGHAPKSYARITIADRGKGMDEVTRDRIFEPFFSTKKRGTGLGLAIVKQIVEQHEGRISVASEVGKGSKFIIDLPL